MTAPFAEMSAEEAAGFMATKEHQPIRRVIAGRCKGKQVIDVGCGRGIGIKDLYDKSLYWGVDCSTHLIHAARIANPGYVFTVQDFRVPDQFEPMCGTAILKSVLEHQESLADAMKIYFNALNILDTVLVAWHTPPIYPETEIITVKASDLAKPLYQNHYKEGSFDREDVHVDVERVDGFTLWTAQRR